MPSFEQGSKRSDASRIEGEAQLLDPFAFADQVLSRDVYDPKRQKEIALLLEAEKKGDSMAKEIMAIIRRRFDAGLQARLREKWRSRSIMSSEDWQEARADYEAAGWSLKAQTPQQQGFENELFRRAHPDRPTRSNPSADVRPSRSFSAAKHEIAPLGTETGFGEARTASELIPKIRRILQAIGEGKRVNFGLTDGESRILERLYVQGGLTEGTPVYDYAKFRFGERLPVAGRATSVLGKLRGLFG